MLENIKCWLTNEQVYMVSLLISVGLASFILGQQSARNEAVSVATPQIVVEQGAFSGLSSTDETSLPRSSTLPALAEQTAQSAQVTGAGGDYVASRSGTRYHHLTCPGAKQIKEENKIFFATPASAEAAGYTRAANCQR